MRKFLFISFTSVASLVLTSQAIALTPAQWDSLNGNTEYYTGTGNGETGGNGNGGSAGGGTTCSSSGGTLDQYMQAEALVESDNDPTAGSPSAASGKYQFEPATWQSWAQQYYGPAQQYTYASAAPEDVQDAVMYLGNISPYEQFNGNVFVLAVNHFWPALDSAAEQDPSVDNSQLDFTPPDNIITVGQYANLVATAVSSGAYQGTALSTVSLTYTDAPDFQTWLAKDGGAPTVTSSTAGSSASSTTCSTGSTTASSSFVYYSQCDPKWANDAYGDPGETICSSGCGPTSVAMVVATMINSAITPVQTAALSMSTGGWESGAGTTWAFLASGPENYGLSAESLGTNMNAAISVLESGGLVIAAGTGAVPFTTAGHIIVLRGIDTNGDIIVGDPDTEASHTVTDEYSPDTIISSGLQDLVGITK